MKIAEGDRAAHLGSFGLSCNGKIIVASALAVATFLHSPILMAQSPSPSTYGGLLSERSTLTGDWGGARDELAARGITIAPSITQFYQGPTAGNAPHVFEYGGKAETFIDVDGAKLGLWDGFGIHVKGEFNYGRTPGTIGGTTVPNNVAMTIPYQNKDGGDFTSAYISQRFGSNFMLLAGKINIVDLYGAAQRFNGGRGIERFQNFALVAPPERIDTGVDVGRRWQVQD